MVSMYIFQESGEARIFVLHVWREALVIAPSASLSFTGSTNVPAARAAGTSGADNAKRTVRGTSSWGWN